MSLLREIQSSAVDANEPISTLLRKCKILAVRLGSSEFKSWVDFELNGYPDIDDMPEYRIMSVSCKGHFSGGFGAAMNNAEIPSNCIPKEYRKYLYTTYMAQPISSLESLINDSDGGTVQEPWPANVTAHFGMKIYQGYNCMQAWKVIPINALVGVLDMIRNRVLNFVLEIESEDPQAGDAPLNSQPVAEEKVQQIFHTHISGNVQNLATGSNHVKQHAINNEQNDMFNELLQRCQMEKGIVTPSSSINHNKLLQLIPFNLPHDGPLNHECGAEYVQKQQKFPTIYTKDFFNPGSIDDDKTTMEYVASLDGDADRIVFHYKDSKGKLVLLDGDKIAALVSSFLQQEVDHLARVVQEAKSIRCGVVQTAYANGASTNYLKVCRNIGDEMYNSRNIITKRHLFLIVVICSAINRIWSRQTSSLPKRV